MKKCRNCNSEFTPTELTTTPQFFCTEACRMAAWAKNSRVSLAGLTDEQKKTVIALVARLRDRKEAR